MEVAFDRRVISAALEQLRSKHIRRKAENSQRQEQVFNKLPRVRELESKRRSLAADTLRRAIISGDDSEAAIRAARKQYRELMIARNSLMAAAGFSPNYLDDGYNCEICSDTGFTDKGSMCDCLFRLCAAKQKAMLSKTLNLEGCSFDNFDFSYYSDAVDSRYDMSPRENIEYIRDISQEYTRSFGNDTANLFLNGGTGLGKTFISGCIASEVALRGHAVVYDLAGHVMSRFESARFDRSDTDAAADTKRYLGSDLLILDDLGTEFSSQMNTATLYTIISTSLSTKRPTIISSNLTLEELNSRYSPQIMSRLGGEYHMLTFFGEDIRMLKRRREMGI